MVVIPAYNEELSLSRVIQKLKIFFTRKQILVVDDGSIDSTLLIAKQLGVEIVRNVRNQGKGFALRKAFLTIISKMPNIEWILTLDADGQHSPEDIPKLISKTISFPNIGIINGKRQYRKMPIFNRISNILTSNWCNFWLNWDIDDLQCGFRLYNVKNLKDIINYGLTCRKFDLETELLFIAWLLDIKLCQIPITTMYANLQRRSRIKPTFDTLRWIRLGIKFGFKLEFFHKIWLTRKIKY
jgi:glycosyltransferase involved in cell wall biosynthesis